MAIPIAAVVWRLFLRYQTRKVRRVMRCLRTTMQQEDSILMMPALRRRSRRIETAFHAGQSC